MVKYVIGVRENNIALTDLQPKEVISKLEETGLFQHSTEFLEFCIY